MQPEEERTDERSDLRTQITTPGDLWVELGRWMIGEIDAQPVIHKGDKIEE